MNGDRTAKRNPILLLVDEDETALLAICLRDLALAAGDLFDLGRHAEEVGLRLVVVESVTVDSLGWLEDEIVWAAHRRDEAATAPRSVRGLLAKGVWYMDHLSLDLRIADGLTDGVNEGEPFGTLTPEAMAQRLRFRLADYDRQREIPVYRQGRGSKPRAGTVVRRLDRRSRAQLFEDVRAQPSSGDRALSHAVDVANTDAVSLTRGT